ncbi:hypothetical protein FHU23_002455 [Clostridium saccharobutylicum]|nr:hypothetical protein [Clostridium saccharobutylicum]MBA8896941.1 hypothetical protein [Clostridium saccharobutylicum]MBA9000932.1 hypothetical protein [Clostridium saccharobutylicum]MBA9012406.1 hypothetical protein [Clostridium saccharobutylicum]NOV55981.1 hypothetical protein [Clostridium saccharobutylicum]
MNWNLKLSGVFLDKVIVKSDNLTANDECSILTG